ncbi:SDR family NAD(P)-dependent oxidoreductase [Mycolicibacterium parafortuitum]|uniref:Short-chain dehydrogenase/reductase SDR [Chitinophaga pinensis DSM 2588] n=1 Tax=Mycolicibacterium parafortuitum TaxID=39692 RepID=A0A375YFZ4_MYCPF|nr:SDR family NAD(P)-dependent oxidoreductase [Mycolicibacterium parafortuitum]ORB28887.1 hypothetical protein BST38_18165 [Mycolicibacterium parafortuitum]SRX79994.1 short-chain dehydrogenase/reductase SDR [Chitinophaga pinensis DSM 2588] [Mycolicibacterium parafortuitum]
MTNKQHPIGTGFGPASTTTDVLAGIDLTGRNAIVTAGHVGLGLETTRALADAGANVVVASRNPGTAAAALAGVDRVRIAQLDLMDPASVDRFVAEHTDTPLHMLINNAGIMGGDLVDADIAPLEPDVRPVSIEMGSGPLTLTPGVTGYAVDPESAEKLWELSEKLLA